MSVLTTVRRAPPLRALEKSVFPFVQWVNHYRTVVKNFDGILYSLNLNELIDSTIYYSGGFEWHTTDSIRRLVRPGDTAIDIGANVGWHTLLFSRIVRESGRVIAFEPMTYGYDKLLRNKGLNPWATNITIEKVAVGDSCGSLAATFSSSWPLFGRVSPPQEEHVPHTTLDSYLSNHQIQRVNAIKVDVDGYELKVLKGADAIIRKHRPILIIELCSETLALVGDSLKDLVAALFSYSYQIRADSEVLPFSSLKAVLDAVPPKTYINVVCEPI